MTETETLVRLDYLGRVHTSLLETGKNVNTSMITLLSLSSLILGIGTGAITINNEFDAVGVKLRLANVIVLLAAYVIVVALQIHVMAMTRYESELRSVVLNVYRALGYEDESMKDRYVIPLEYPNFFTTAMKWTARDSTVMGRVLNGIGIVSIAAAMFVLPFAAEIVGAVAIVTSPDSRWWSFLILGVAVIAVLFYFARYAKAWRAALLARDAVGVASGS